MADEADGMEASNPLSVACSSPIARPWIRNRWEELTFLHWPCDPAIIQALLPSRLRVDTVDDQAWVSLVPFRMRHAGPNVIPAIPWLSSFAETNVRTYVVDSAGHRAVWFLSLDAARLPIVAFARWTIGFPYVWSQMAIDVVGERRTYTTTSRRWPRRPAASTVVTIDIGEPITEPSPLDLFLTARWGTVAQWRRQLRYHPVDHPPWTLHHAELVNLDDSLVAAAIGSTGDAAPIVRWAQPLDAVFGRPVRV